MRNLHALASFRPFYRELLGHVGKHFCSLVLRVSLSKINLRLNIFTRGKLLHDKFFKNSRYETIKNELFTISFYANFYH